MSADATFDVGKIEAEMTLDVSPFQAGLNAAKRKARDAKGQIDRSLNFEADANTTKADAKIKKTKAEAASLGAMKPTVDVGIDTTEWVSTLAALTAETLLFTKQVYTAKVAADTRPFVADIASLRGLVSATPFTASVHLNMASAMAQLAYLRAAFGQSGAVFTAGPGGTHAPGAFLPEPWIGGGGTKWPGSPIYGVPSWPSSGPERPPLALGPGSGGGSVSIPVSTPGGSSASGGFLSFLGGLFGRGGGGSGNGKSFLLKLLWGGGSKGFMGVGGGLAGFGSLGAMAGLGTEHLLMTGAGLAGSAGGAMLGAGLLGLGSAGVLGVGMGTDLAGIGQAAGDIKATTTAMNNLNQAIAVYGPKSYQAAAAQGQLNYTLSGFSPIARAAVVQASQTAIQFRTLFDAATGAAESTGAKIITQVMKVGETFLPTIGKFAAQNMKLIQSGLQPLFAWIQGPGLAIFTNLEKIFQQGLPTAMHALNQGFQLFAKTVNVAAGYTGGFIHIIDRFVTKWNSPPNFARWTTEIGKLVGLFHLWAGLIKIAAADVYQLFHNDVGTGSAIVTTLTQMLTKLHEWETSTRGKQQLHSIFATHKKEVIALLGLLPPLLSSLGQIELAIAPLLTSAVTLLVTGLHGLLGLPIIGHLTAMALGFALVAKKLGLLGPAFKLFNRLVGKHLTSWLLQTTKGIAKILLAYTKYWASKSLAAAKAGVSWLADGAKRLVSWLLQTGKGIAKTLLAWTTYWATKAASAAKAGVAWLADNAKRLASWLLQTAGGITKTLLAWTGYWATKAKDAAVAGLAWLVANGKRLASWLLADGVAIATDAAKWLAMWVARSAQAVVQGAIWLAKNAATLTAYLLANTTAEGEVEAGWATTWTTLEAGATGANASMVASLGPIVALAAGLATSYKLLSSGPVQNFFKQHSPVGTKSNPNFLNQTPAQQLSKYGNYKGPGIPTGALGGIGGQIHKYALGGFVPGPIGQAALAIIHGGETVLPADPAAAARMLAKVATPVPSLGTWGSPGNAGRATGAAPVVLHVTVQVGNEEFQGVVKAQAEEVLAGSISRVITLTKQGPTRAPVLA